MKLIPVDPANEEHLRVLYELLEERPADASISHKKMPTWDEHVAFVDRMRPKPRSGPFDLSYITPEPRLGEPRYQGWFLVEGLKPSRIVGSVYLTAGRNEIGVAVYRQYQGMGLGPDAVYMLMQKYGPARYLANIAPANEASRKMFEKLGFRTVQHTLMLEAK